MRSMTVAAIFLSFIFACAQKETSPDVDGRISRIENGLIELDLSTYTPADLFNPDSSQLANPMTLTERMQFYKVPAASIAVINDYRIEWTKAYGTMDVNTGAPATTGTIFEAGSTSKLVTAVMALRLVQDGLIDLDRDVNDYLTSWKVPENEFTSSEKVTLRRLLTHRAGMPATDYDTDDSGEYPTLIDVLNGASPAKNAAAVPEFVPGSRWQYSNIGYNVIQLLLEDVSGKSFQDIAEELVFKPLGMKSSTFIYPLDDGRKMLEAMPHDAEGISRMPQMHNTALAQGGLTSTPEDLAKLTIELMLSFQGRSVKIISKNTMRQMFQKECEIDQAKTYMPFSQGLGVFIMREGKDFLFTHPGGNTPGLQCWLIGWPERGTGAVVMANSANGLFLGAEIINAVDIEYNGHGR